MKNRTLILLISMCSMLSVYSQRNITQEEYKKIITTDTYFWGRSDFDLPLDAAKKQAYEELKNEMSKIEQSINESDLLKKATLVKLEVEGDRTRIIVFIPKDSLYMERVVDTVKSVNEESVIRYKKDVAVEKSVTEKPKETTEPSSEIIVRYPTTKPTSVPAPPAPVSAPISVSASAPTSAPAPMKSGNEIIDTLLRIAEYDNFCVQLNKYKRQGKLFDNQSGTAPDKLENCMIAIFKNDVLEALYDKGSISRKDFLTGKTIQKPEDDYKSKQGIKVILIKLN